jgi:PKD repeat protein
MIVLAGLVALALNVTSAALWGGAQSAAYACGIGSNTPTMLANRVPALANPIPIGTNISGNQPLGVFALQYVAGGTISFAEDTSLVPNAPPPGSYQLRWTFGDGSPAVVAPSPSHAFAQPGTYSVLVEYRDASSPNWDQFDSAKIEVISSTLANPPVAHLTADTTAIASGGTITFDASGSHVVVGSHLKYEWNFNDATDPTASTSATGPHATHTFNALGNGFVALTVIDDRGARSVATIDIGVVSSQQQLPTASLTASSAAVQAGQSVSFDASGSEPATQPDGDQIVRYNWDFGDGSPEQTTQSATTSHVYRQAGQYRVAVQAVDSQGTPAQATLEMVVEAAGSASSGSDIPAWALGVVGVLVLAGLAFGGWYIMAQRRQQARIQRQRAAMAELQRARRIPHGGVRPGDPRWGDPRADGRGVSRPPPARARPGERRPAPPPSSGGPPGRDWRG